MALHGRRGHRLTSLFTGGGPPDTGWTFYVPFSARTGTNVSLAVFGVFMLGFSSILTGLNFVTTIHRLRAKGMTWGRLPLFVWSLYATAWVQILATPILGITLVLVMAERVFGTGSSIPAAAATRSCTSTCSGSIPTRRSTS